MAEDARGAGAARQRRGAAPPRQHPRRGDRAGPGGHRLRPDQRRARRRRGGRSGAAERREPGPRSSGRPGPERCRGRWRARRVAGVARAGAQGHLRRRRRRSGDVRAAVHQRRGEPGGAGGGRERQRRAQFDAGRRPGAPPRARGARAARPALPVARGRGAQGGAGRQDERGQIVGRERGAGVRRAHRRERGADRRVRDPDRSGRAHVAVFQQARSRAIHPRVDRARG